MVLTDKQRYDLHVAILEYLKIAGFDDAAKEFCAEIASKYADHSISLETTPIDLSKTPLLERKWKSILRLQHKLLEAESKMKQMEQDFRARNKPGGAEIRSSSGAGSGAKLESQGGGSFNLNAAAKLRMEGHRGIITCVAFHPVYHLVVSGSEDASIKVWDSETGEFERTLKGHTNGVAFVAFDQGKGELLASCSSDLSIKIWDFKSGSYNCMRTLLGHDHSVSCIRFIDSQRLVSCSRDASLKIWDTSTGYCLHTLTGHSDWVRQIHINAEATLVASGSSDHTVRIWDLTSKKEVARMVGHTHVVECVAFTSSKADRAIAKALQKDKAAPVSLDKKGGSHVISGSRDLSIRIWLVQTGECIQLFTGHDNWVRAVVVQPLGQYIVSCSDDKTIKIWDLEESRCIRTITDAHEHFVTCLDVHHKAALVASGSVDSSIRIWTGV